MNVVIARNWWSLVIRGLVGILIGMITFAWPGITFAGIVMVFAAYAAVDGLFSLVGAVQAAQAHERWGALVFLGVTGIAASVITVLWPAITAFVLIVLIAAWAIVTGVFEIAAAVRLRHYIEGEWRLALAGIASLVFGILILVAPLAGALVIALWVGAYALASGVMLVLLGIKLRSWGRRVSIGHSVPLPAR